MTPGAKKIAQTSATAAGPMATAFQAVSHVATIFSFGCVHLRSLHKVLTKGVFDSCNNKRNANDLAATSKPRNTEALKCCYTQSAEYQGAQVAETEQCKFSMLI